MNFVASFASVTLYWHAPCRLHQFPSEAPNHVTLPGIQPSWLSWELIQHVAEDSLWAGFSNKLRAEQPDWYCD